MVFSLSQTMVYGQQSGIGEMKVGFNCGIFPQPTSLVDKMAKLITDKKYSEISGLLNSENSGEVYLAVIVLERLDRKELYKLDEDELFLISKIKSIPTIVVTCFGCFLERSVSTELFDEENSIGEKDWLDRLLPIN